MIRPVTQFNYNDDLPSSDLVAPPSPFPEPVIDSCERITTRVQMESGVCVVTHHVLVPRPSRGYHHRDRGDSSTTRVSAHSTPSSCSSSSSCSDDSMSDDDSSLDEAPEPEQAYLILPEQVIRSAIYGQVVEGFVLRRRQPRGSEPYPCDWEKTSKKCAIKEMEWEKIRQDQNNLAEDPRKEMATMRYLKNHFDGLGYDWDKIHLMCPLDIVQDDRYLYCIMPFMDNGDLFDVLDAKRRFPEDECRYWMDQLLIGVEQMQNAGVCHRDMSLENTMVDSDKKAIIIDWGMCLKIPYYDPNPESNTIEAMTGNMTLNSNARIPQAQSRLEMESQRRRYLIHKRERCGKWFYMSPEVYGSVLRGGNPNYDGHAVDLWACGVMLFSMATGYPPWSRPDITDEKFKYMTDGYLVQIVRQWDLGLSGDLLDLLERMLFREQKQRLSLAQVRAHPWMINGPRTISS